MKYKAKLRARVEADSAEEVETNSIAAMEEELVAEAAGKPKSKTTKAKTTKAKTTKTTTKGKEKTACQFCGKLYVFIDKHEKKCKKNPENQ